MSSLSSASIQGSSPSELNGWLVMAASLLTFAFIVLTIYVDVITGLNNAVTPHEKDVMRFLGVILGLFASISIILTSILLKKGDYIKAFLSGLLAVFLNLYHLSVWMAFFAGIGSHYSKLEFQNSLAYKAQQTALEILGDSDSVVVDAKTIDVKHMVNLKNILTNEEIAIKKCNRILGWRKVQDCKTEHKQHWALANNELAVLTSAQKYHADNSKQQLEKISALKELESKAKNPEITLLPLFKTISDNTEEGLKYQRYFAYLLAFIAILITDGGFFLVRGLINKGFSFAPPQKQVRSQTQSEGGSQQQNKQTKSVAKKPADLEKEKMDLLDLFQKNYKAHSEVVPIKKADKTNMPVYKSG